MYRPDSTSQTGFEPNEDTISLHDIIYNLINHIIGRTLAPSFEGAGAG